MNQTENMPEETNPLLSSAPSEPSAEDRPDYFPMIWPEKNTLYAASSSLKSETHLILAGNSNGARIGKTATNKSNMIGLSSNSLQVNLSMFETIFDTLEIMNSHLKYLKASKQLTNFLSMESNGYKTFGLEDNAKYRLTFMVFNNGSIGWSRFFNPHLTTKKGGENHLILAKNSLLMYPDMDHLYKDLRMVFDAAVISHAKKEEFVGMTFFVLSQFARLPEDEFARLTTQGKIEKKISQFFQEGLSYLNEKNRMDIISQRVRFRNMVPIDKELLASVRIAVSKFIGFCEKLSLPYYLGDCHEFEKDIPASEDAFEESSDTGEDEEEEEEVPENPPPPPSSDNQQKKKKGPPPSLKELIRQVEAAEAAQQEDIQKLGNRKRKSAGSKEGTTKRRNVQVIITFNIKLYGFKCSISFFVI